MPFTEEEKTLRGERNFARTVQLLMKARIVQRSAALFGVGGITFSSKNDMLVIFY